MCHRWEQTGDSCAVVPWATAVWLKPLNQIPWGLVQGQIVRADHWKEKLVTKKLKTILELLKDLMEIDASIENRT